MLILIEQYSVVSYFQTNFLFDPADSNRVIIKKIVQISPHTYVYEETRITRNEGIRPTVYTQMSKLAGIDLKENISNKNFKSEAKTALCQMCQDSVCTIAKLPTEPITLVLSRIHSGNLGSNWFEWW